MFYYVNVTSHGKKLLHYFQNTLPYIKLNMRIGILPYGEVFRMKIRDMFYVIIERIWKECDMKVFNIYE